MNVPHSIVTSMGNACPDTTKYFKQGKEIRVVNILRCVCACVCVLEIFNSDMVNMLYNEKNEFK